MTFPVTPYVWNESIQDERLRFSSQQPDPWQIGHSKPPMMLQPPHDAKYLQRNPWQVIIHRPRAGLAAVGLFVTNEEGDLLSSAADHARPLMCANPGRVSEGRQEITFSALS